GTAWSIRASTLSTPITSSMRCTSAGRGPMWRCSKSSSPRSSISRGTPADPTRGPSRPGGSPGAQLTSSGLGERVGDAATVDRLHERVRVDRRAALGVDLEVQVVGLRVARRTHVADDLARLHLAAEADPVGEGAEVGV